MSDDDYAADVSWETVDPRGATDAWVWIERDLSWWERRVHVRVLRRPDPRNRLGWNTWGNEALEHVPL